MPRRRLARALSAIVVLLAASANADVSTELDGQFAVGTNGDARYTLELPLPPGIGGEPNLVLAYSSQRGDDRLGLGWRLQGLSAITRCAAIPATDGFRGTVAYTDDDRYCLDGQRLINVEGDYGSPGSVYRTELETWRLVTASSSRCGSGPCSFTVVGRGGDQASYGTTEDSRVLAVGRPDVRVWALAATSDLDGNTTSYRYTQAPTAGVTAAFGQFYASEIAYTTNPGGGVATANRFVRFAYTPRQLPLSAFVGGSRVYGGALLATVRTYVGDAIVREWRLDYAQPATQAPTLTGIVECAGSAADAACLSPTRVSYQDPGKVTFSGSSLITSLPGHEAVIPLDVNGDGRGDLAYVTGTASALTVTPLISDGTTLAACSTSLSLPRPAGCRLDGKGSKRCALLPAALDGDGRGDLVFAFASGAELAYATFTAGPGGCAFADGPSNPLGVPANYDDLWPMDVNGDGVTDLVAGWKAVAEETLATFIGGANGFTHTGTFTLPVQPGQRLWPAEVNGDGELDLVQVFWTGGGAIQLATWLSTGASFAAGPVGEIPSGSANLEGLWPLDVNGDGKTDLVQGFAQGGSLELATFLANGAGGFVCESPDEGGGFVPRCTTDTAKGLTNVRAFWPMDADGDGRIDLVQAWQRGGALELVVYSNATTGLSTGEDAGTSIGGDTSAVFPLDWTGDGKTDLVQLDQAAGIVTIYGYRSDGPIPGLAAAIENNLGGVFRPTYAPMSDGAVYSQGATDTPGTVALAYPYRQASAQAPYQQVGGGHLQLVAEVLRSNEPATNSSTYAYRDRYDYEGALVDLASGRGWAGFRRTRKLQLATGQRTVTSFNQAWPLTGTTAEIEYQCDGTISPDPRCPAGAAATVLSDSDTVYVAPVTATGASAPHPQVVEVLTQRLTMTTYDYGVYDFARAKSYEYDAYGNQTLLADWGYVDHQGQNLDPQDDVFTCSRFDNSQGANDWELGYLRARKVAAVATCDDFEHFDDATDFSLERLTYTPRRNLETQSTYDNGNRVFLTTRYGYDAFGNQTSQTLPGERTTSYQFEPTYHTYVACTLTPPNENGQHLAVATGYDPRFGVQVASTSPTLTAGSECPSLAGVAVLTLCVDDFGRGVATQGPIPTLPAGVVGDANCVPATVTGDATAFRSAAVTTLTVTDNLADEHHRRLVETRNLQSWTVAGASPSTRFHRAFRDGLGREYLTADQHDAAGALVASCANFDADDKATRSSIPRVLASDDIACTSSSGSADLLWTTSRFDVYGRVVEQVAPGGPDGKAPSVTTMAYERDVKVTLTQAVGQPEQLVKQLDYDYFASQRQLVSLTLPQDGKATTRFTYDRIGRLTSMTDPPTATSPTGVANTVTYDSLDRRLTVDNPDQSSCLLEPAPGCSPTVKALTLTYSPTTGFLASTTDAKGQRNTFAYDALGRMTSKVLSAADGGTGAGTGTVRYHFDDPAVADGAGELTALEETDSAGVRRYRYRYAYDRYGQPSATTLELDGESYTSRVVDDPLGRASQLTEPDGSVVDRTYDMGNLAALVGTARTYARFTEYSAFGLPGLIRYGNGATEAFTYTPTGQPRTQTITDSHTAKLLDLVLDANRLQQIIASTDRLKAGGTDRSQSFRYDLTRLAAASAPGLYGDLAFGYDAAGNLTAKDGRTIHYQAHRAVAVTGGDSEITLAYDRNGNLETRRDADDERTFTYDVRNRLIRVADPARGALLEVPLYDDHGRRLKKRTPDGVETLYVSATYQLVRFPDGHREATRLINDDAGTVATITTALGAAPPEAAGVPTPGTLYLHHDVLRSTALTTDEDGLLASRVAYVPYGGLFAPATTGPDNFRPKFQGKELDLAADLYDFGSRVYDPVLGRFTTPDSELADDFTTPDVLNRYAFSLNDPTTLIDPSGHNVWEAIGGALIGIAEITLGVAVDVLSEGALEPLGGALIGAGLNGVQYSTTHSANFSWKQLAIDEGTGAAFGLLTGGFGGEAEAGVSAATEVGEEAGAAMARSEAEQLTARGAGEALESSSERNVADELGETTAGREDFSPEEGAGGDDADCGCACRASFPAGVPVWLAEGRLAIEAFEGNESVLSRSSLDFATQPRPVTLALQRRAEALTELELEAADGRRERLEITAQHPLWVETVGWVPASELAVGQMVATLDDHARVVAVAAEPTAGTRVYNIEVDGLRSYFVGELGVWVHNPGGCYTLRDDTGEVVRTGRTGDLAAREAQHARGADTRDLEFRVEYRTDDYAEQRGLEHRLYERYPDAQRENGGLNRMKAIRDDNPRRQEYLDAADAYLARTGARRGPPRAARPTGW
jgi:RHS repeat-associated protein